MAAEFQTSSSSELPAAKPEEVQCDFCTETKQKAIKFCLKCESFFCQTHLEPHLVAAQLQSHQLINPGENMEDRICKEHEKPLELFCVTDQTCVCLLCPVLDHKNHEFVPLEEEYERRKSMLGKTEAEIHQKIQQRQQKIQEMNQSAQLNKEAADKEKADGEHVFHVLKQCVEKDHADFVEMVEKQITTEKRAEGFVKDLQLEISELMEKAAVMEHISQSEDPVHLIQSFPTLSTAPATKDWTKIKVQQSSYEGIVGKAVAQLEETLTKEIKKIQENIELQRIKQFVVQVPLDPDAAEPYFTVCDDGKQACVDVRKKHQNNPQKFKRVLEEQIFLSKRYYFEVDTKGKHKFTIGVARKSSYRKGGATPSPQNGHWVIMLTNSNEVVAYDSPRVQLRLKSKPEKVGVFVDYVEGLVSFYDVSAGSLIFSFTGCSFNSKPRPFFMPQPTCGSKSSAPLIGSAVNHTKEKHKSVFGSIRCFFKKKNYKMK